MIENLMENQKQIFDFWENFFKKSNSQKIDNPFLKMDKTTDIYKDFYDFYNNFYKNFLSSGQSYDFTNFQKMFSDFQNNYSNIVLKIMGIDNITPDKIFENFYNQFAGLNLFSPIVEFLKNNNNIPQNFNYGTFENLLKMPSFWLTRELNELIKEVIKNLLEYSKKVEEFRETIANQSKKGFDLFLNEIKSQPYIIDFDKFFKNWVNSNEKIFQDFFKSEEYGILLKNLISSGAKLKKSLDKYTFQLLKDSNIATKQELDRASKEIYLLKKELKSIKDSIKELEEKISIMGEESK